jgi:septal ring factor EnvC (AmiA/AmiB activator)
MTDDNDTNDNTAANHSMPDPFVLAISLCQIATSAKATEPALKRLRKLGHDIAKAEQKLAAVTAQAEQTNAELAARVAAADERDRALDARQTAFESELQDARDNLRGYYNQLTEADRRLRFHILASADLLHGYNERLQTLPDWQQIRNMVPNMPPDPPSVEREGLEPGFRIDALSDTFSDPHADRHGNAFLNTLTRDVAHRTPNQEVR